MKALLIALLLSSIAPVFAQAVDPAPLEFRDQAEARRFHALTAELRGEPFVLNVWGSWCPECRVEHPVLTRFAETKRVRVVGYNLKDEPADALRWLDQFGNPYWLVVTDYDGRAAIDWGIYGAPETFLVDGNGVIRWKHVGPMSDDTIADELVPALERIEAGE